MVRRRAAERREIPRASVAAEMLQHADGRCGGQRGADGEQQLAAIDVQTAGERRGPTGRRQERKSHCR